MAVKYRMIKNAHTENNRMMTVIEAKGGFSVWA